MCAKLDSMLKMRQTFYRISQSDSIRQESRENIPISSIRALLERREEESEENVLLR